MFIPISYSLLRYIFAYFLFYFFQDNMYFTKSVYNETSVKVKCKYLKD